MYTDMRGYFVLLTNAEYDAAVQNGKVLNGSTKVLRFESYTILIYGRNIFGV